jgi:hypothetical protein
MKLRTGKIIIGSLWIVGFFVLFGLITAQTLIGSLFADKTQEAWEWFSPHIFPTLGLVLGGFIVDSQKNVPPNTAHPSPSEGDSLETEPTISGGLVAVTFLFSLTHFLILLAVMIIASNKLTVEETFASLKSASIPLGAIQGAVTLTLGIFFKKS